MQCPAFAYGYPDNTIKPYGKITRADSAVIISKLKGLELTDNLTHNTKIIKVAGLTVP